MILFALRGLAVSLSVFVLVYAVLRLTVACGWSLSRQRFPGLSPNALYALQVGPFMLAAFIVAGFTIPSFIRFEPRIVQETFGPPAVVLSVICLVLFGVGLCRTYRAYVRTDRIVRRWSGDAKLADGSSGVPICQTGSDAPPMVVAGFFRPRLLISASTVKVLTEKELARAISHESAHVRRHDNLKKLALRACSFPRASQIEQQWLAALELDADRYAVRNKAEALDLASALVKASRLGMAGAEFTTNLAEGGQLLHMRVHRLLEWDATPTSNRLLGCLTAALAFATGVAVILCYHGILLRMHTLAELLMQ